MPAGGVPGDEHVHLRHEDQKVRVVDFGVAVRVGFGVVDYGQIKTISAEQRKTLARLIIALADGTSRWGW